MNRVEPNLIEATTKYPDAESAQDALAGVRTMPGFIFGYVRLGPNELGVELVTIVDCVSGAAPMKGQRRVVSLSAE